MVETVIQGAEVYDGSGRPPNRADVLVGSGRIIAVEPAIGTTGRTVVAARGLALAPGLIDMHSHADFTLPAYPSATNSLSQGVTTEVLGNCGWSPAPLSSTNNARRADWSQVAEALGPDLAWTWSGFGGFLDLLDLAKPAVNCVPLVGHGAIRSAVFGIEDRAPTSAELTEMRGLLADAAVAGAWGMSTGLVYPPSQFAEIEEIHALAGDVASWGGMYATHMRGEGVDLAVAVEEAVAVSRATGVRVQISHLKAAGPSSHGSIDQALSIIDAARGEGLAVGCDVYPYLAGSTVLTQLLPAWASVGGVDALMERLASDDVRARLAAELQRDPTSYLRQAGGWPQVMIAAVENERLKRYEGRFVAEIAAERETDEATVVFDLLEQDRARTTMILFLMIEADVDKVLDHPSAVIGSDGLGVVSASARVHPRAYGTFVRVLRRGVERGETALADMISRCTSRTAGRLGLTDRGLVAPGYVADLVLFDPQKVADQATYEDPTRAATGIEAVYLRGQLAFDSGEVIDASLGQVLRRPPIDR